MSTPASRPPSLQPPALELPADLPVEYVNLVRIAHSPSELVFDFAHALPGVVPARVQSRIVMSPLAAKLFASALIENLNRFESAYGVIQVPGGITLADMLFRSHGPEEDKEQK